jgi:hypothetical protein
MAASYFDDIGQLEKAYRKAAKTRDFAQLREEMERIWRKPSAPALLALSLLCFPAVKGLGREGLACALVTLARLAGTCRAGGRNGCP